MSDLTLKTVTMKDGSQKIKLLSDYNAELVKRCRQLGGTWNGESKAWYFPADLAPQLRQACLDIFGIDPLAETPVDLVDVHFALEHDWSRLADSGRQSLWLFGREVLTRPGRDSAVRPGEGVSIIGGGFARSGGSMRYPSLGAVEEGTTLLIRGVPRPMALAFQAEKDEGVITLVEQEPPATLILEQAKAAAGALASLLQKLSKDEQDIVIHGLVESLQKQVA